MRNQSRRLVFAAVVLGLSAGCASAPKPLPGTGDIAFRLHWQGKEDLDLHVQEPSGTDIDFVQRRSGSGGELDVDCNSAADRLCGAPIENVFWPVGKAPEGAYTYWVEVVLHPGDRPSVPYTLQILEGQRVVHTETGALGPSAQSSPQLRFTFQRGPVVAGKVGRP